MPIETIYANVLGSNYRGYIHSIILNVYYSLNESYNFLKIASDAIKNSIPELSYQPWKNWEEETDDEEVISEIKKVLEEHSEAIVIRLKEPETDEEVKAFEAFIEARYVLSSRDLRKGKSFKVLYSNEDLGILILDKKPNTKKIYLKPNDYVIKCQMDALRNLQNTPHPLHRPLIRLFEKKDRVKWEEFDLETISDWHFLNDDSIDGVKIQREFVQIALSTPDFAILEGPPGSGKTTTICELILQAVKRQQRVLLTASTHVAVDNVLERIKDREEIVAVRIGDEYRISPSVREFQINNMKKTEKRRLMQRLRNIPLHERLESQNMLLEVLESNEDSNSALTNLILQSANLVCGTTIGILQHPDIKALRHKKGRVEPMFDLLIIDESSKTTFTEFLVPALLARRWILVGDPKQLSPYIDDAEIEANVDVIVKDHLDSREQQVCLDAYQIIKSARRNYPLKLLVVSDDYDVLDKYERQIKYLLNSVEADILMIRLDENFEEFTSNQINSLELLGASIVLSTPRMIRRYHDKISTDFDIVRLDKALPPSLERKIMYWHCKKEKNSESQDKDQENTLVHEIAWRLKRHHELRFLPQDKNWYFKEIEQMLPHWDLISDDFSTTEENVSTEQTLSEKIKRSLETIARIAFPSIIESLLKGIDQKYKRKQNFVLYAGLSDEARQKRHRILKYQQRMHPDISKFPRTHIYDDEALKDPSNFARKRELTYTRYGNHRAVWVPCRGIMESRKNVNETEAKAIIDELKRFLSWARDNPKLLVTRENSHDENEKEWVIAILTFYRSQELVLKKKLRSLFKNKFSHHVFRSRKFPNTKVELYTVDKYQGHEADVVFLSFVKSSWEKRNNRRKKRPPNSIGFLDSVNRLNVAITRARYLLVLVGDKEYLANQNRSEVLKKLATEIPEAKKLH